jgi:hypothetical protein
VPRGTIVAAVRHLDAITFHPIVRCPKREQALLDHLAAWHERHIVHGERPPMDGSEAGDILLRRMYPAENRPALRQAVGPEQVALARLRTARHALQAAEKADEIAVQQVKEIIGDAAGLEGPAGRVTWKANKPSSKTDHEAVAAALTRALGEHVGVPEAQRIAAAAVTQNTVTKPGARVLRVSFPGED